jgi:hypothetical protein
LKRKVPEGPIDVGPSPPRQGGAGANESSGVGLTAPTGAVVSTGVRGLVDQDLANCMRAPMGRDGQTLIVVNQFTSALFGRDEPSQAWALLGAGEFGPECLEAAKPLVRRGKLQWAVTPVQPSEVDPAGLTIGRATMPVVKDWLRTADRATTVSGRTGEVSVRTMDEVAIRAAWRCQFPGCGKDLTTHFATGRRGNYGYFAHIVASSPDGPRGDPVESARLADDANNIMLACDECHRLIDRVAPHLYPAEVLREMRSRSVEQVERLLNSLRYPEVEPILMLGNISGQPHHFSQRAAEEALWKAGLRLARGKPEVFCLNGNHLHDPHAPHYWGSLFEALKTDVPRLQALLNGTRLGGGIRPEFAVFPLHGTSILMVGGRLIGDTGGVHLFQFHRDQLASNVGAQWAWPTGVVEPAAEKYQVTKRRDWRGEDEACLVVSLTFEISAQRLPSNCATASGFLLPTVVVSADRFGSDVVGHPKDLELFGKALDEALRVIQDEWKVRRIHLFVGAPATACFRVGQKMQARNQATFVCHETGRGNGSPFKRTIEISSDIILEPVSGQRITL